MVLPTSGPLSIDQIHIEAGGATTTAASLNDTDIRALTPASGKTINSTPNTTIDVFNFYGATSEVTYDQQTNFDQYDLLPSGTGNVSGLSDGNLGTGQAGNSQNGFVSRQALITLLTGKTINAVTTADLYWYGTTRICRDGSFDFRSGSVRFWPIDSSLNDLSTSETFGPTTLGFNMTIGTCSQDTYGATRNLLNNASFTSGGGTYDIKDWIKDGCPFRVNPSGALSANTATYEAYLVDLVFTYS